MSALVRCVEYAKALDGKLIAVEAGPYKGWAVGEIVYASKREALDAVGKLNQQSYIDEQMSEIHYGLGQMIDSASPFVGWRKKYDDDERQSDLRNDIVDQMFPRYGKRSEYVERFVEAFLLANDAYEELHKS